MRAKALRPRQPWSRHRLIAGVAIALGASVLAAPAALGAGDSWQTNGIDNIYIGDPCVTVPLPGPYYTQVCPWSGGAPQFHNWSQAKGQNQGQYTATVCLWATTESGANVPSEPYCAAEPANGVNYVTSYGSSNLWPFHGTVQQYNEEEANQTLWGWFGA